MKLRLNLLMICLATLVGMSSLRLLAASDVAGAFDAANKLYEQGKFADAASAYQKLIQSGSVSPAFYFNLGNALFKSSQIGRAIAAYRQAAQLTPRDPDVRANLQFARNQVQGPTLRASRWERWLGALSLNEWAWLASGAIWLAFLLLAAMQLRPELGRVLRNYAIVTGAAAVALSACLGWAISNHTTANTAIVIARAATVRAGPLDESPSAFTANDGAELRMLDRKDDWLQVTDGTRRVGWLRREQTLILPVL
jgi:tetratricopeptide (TPR) repeat protein